MSKVVKLDNSRGKDAPPLPHNIEAEQSLLGAIMVNNDAYARISHILEAEDFYEPIHREIFDIITHLIGKDRIATPITMKELASEIAIEGMTPLAYMARLMAEATTVINAVDYAKIIKDAAIRRRVFMWCEATQKSILEKPIEAVEVIDSAESFFTEVRPLGNRAEQFRPFARAVATAQENASVAYSRKNIISGMSTGIPKIDAGLGGMNRGDLVVLAARPGMGKTALASNITLNVALDLRERQLDKQKTGVVAFASLEMPDYQLASRMMAEYSKIATWRVRQGKVSEDEIKRYLDAGSNLANLPIHIDQTGALPIDTLLYRLRMLRKRVGVELVIVDYLQLLKGSNRGKRGEFNRVNELTEITGALKAIAKELDVPVVALSQLSRKVEERDDKRPQLSDLRESGSIEQDADVVMFIYREEYYLKAAEPPAGTERHNEWQLRMEAAHGRADVIISKNRHGPGGTVHVGFDDTLMQFHNDPPDQVVIAAKDKRPEKAKAHALPGDALQAHRQLQTLLTMGLFVENDSHISSVARGTKLIEYQKWKEKCVSSILDTANQGDPKKASKKMEDISKALFKANLIGRAGTEAKSWVWLVEQK